MTNALATKDKRCNMFSFCNKMAATLVKCVFHHKVPFTILKLPKNSIHTSSCILTVQSSKVKITPKRNKPISYEAAYAAPHIGFRKSWNSWNTSTMEGGLRKPQIAIDDIFIRKFIYGTFPGLLLSEVIIKRQHNIIRIAAVINPRLSQDKMCFLTGYTEELLSYWFHCIVKLELQYVIDPEKMIFKHV